MTRDFFDPAPEQQNVVLIDLATLRQAERLIESCENCHPAHAETPLDWLLDRLTGSDSTVTRTGGSPPIAPIPPINLRNWRNWRPVP
jgi:hypothetical protein